MERAAAFDKLAMREALTKHPEPDGTYKVLYDAHRVRQDAVYLWAEIPKELYSDQLMGDGMTLGESK